jgi:hypothetical protein
MSDNIKCLDMGKSPMFCASCTSVRFTVCYLCYINHISITSIMLLLLYMQTIGRLNLHWNLGLCDTTQE